MRRRAGRRAWRSDGGALRRRAERSTGSASHRELSSAQTARARTCFTRLAVRSLPAGWSEPASRRAGNQSACNAPQLLELCRVHVLAPHFTENDSSAPAELLPQTQDVKALMAKFAQVCRDSGILGVTHPDTGVHTGTEGVGDCPEEIMELWPLLDTAAKHAWTDTAWRWISWLQT